MTLADRFWEKVDKTGGPDACWPWTAFRDKDGYGRFRVAQRTMRASRVAWTLTHGPSAFDVLHSCDNPPCCNPSHLHEGDQLLNVAEMVARGRSLSGSRHPRAKLTESQVAHIRHRLSGGDMGRALAAEYGVSEAAISRIRLCRRWRA